MPRECIVSARHAENAGIDLVTAVAAAAVVAVVAAAAAAGDVDVDLIAAAVDFAAAVDGTNVVGNYPVVASHQAVSTFPETSSALVVQCFVPYFPPQEKKNLINATPKPLSKPAAIHSFPSRKNVLAGFLRQKCWNS